MSGHSKWATIKRQKGVNDAKRGQLFTKLANAITIAVRQGGGNTDPEFNATLRLAIDKAKAANMPKDNIERSVQKGAGGAGGVSLEETVYEGFTPGGAGLIIEAVTDKKQRTVAEVKSVLEKNGGTLVGQGAVSYLFEHVGEIVVPLGGKSSDDLLTIALENGANDFEVDGDLGFIYTDATNVMKVKEGVEDAGFKIEEAGLVYKPTNRMTISSDAEEKTINLIEKIEELDDVQKVYTNVEFSS